MLSWMMFSCVQLIFPFTYLFIKQPALRRCFRMSRIHPWAEFFRWWLKPPTNRIFKKTPPKKHLKTENFQASNHSHVMNHSTHVFLLSQKRMSYILLRCSPMAETSAMYPLIFNIDTQNSRTCERNYHLNNHHFPIQSMYGILTYIWLNLMVHAQ